MSPLRAVLRILYISQDLLLEALRFLRLLVSPKAALAAEILFLRKQLMFYQERKIKPRRFNDSARVSLLLLAKLFDWKNVNDNNQQKPQQQQQQQKGLCDRINSLGNKTAGAGAGAFLIGTALDVTGIGVPVGAYLNFTGGVAMGVGGAEVGIAELCGYFGWHD
jgi:hypothetical protein